jgi:hypothetical protein
VCYCWFYVLTIIFVCVVLFSLMQNHLIQPTNPLVDCLFIICIIQGIFIVRLPLMQHVTYSCFITAADATCSAFLSPVQSLFEKKTVCGLLRVEFCK